MNEIIQWIIAGLIVIAASVYLIRRIFIKKKCCGRDSHCGKCGKHDDNE